MNDISTVQAPRDGSSSSDHAGYRSAALAEWRALAAVKDQNFSPWIVHLQTL
jgi:hypothetical protein